MVGQRFRPVEGARPTPKAIQVGVYNTNKSAVIHAAFLVGCDQKELEVVVINEPWISRHDATRTQTHSNYDMYSPADTWEPGEATRPRVLLYVRRGARLQVERRESIHPRDLLWLDINGYAILAYYREPGNNEVIDYLTALNPPRNCLAVGDANARHTDWEPGVIQRYGGAHLARWAVRTNMGFIGTLGEATHRAGHVLDLPFSNIPAATSKVDKSLIFGSDHLPLLVTIPSRGTEPPPETARRWNVPDTDLERFYNLTRMASHSLPKTGPTSTRDELDTAATALSEMIRDCIQTVGRTTRTIGKSAPWWTPECRKARDEWRKDDSQRHDGPDRRRFLKVCRDAKRQHWRTVIDGAKDADLIRVINWHKKE